MKTALVLLTLIATPLVGCKGLPLVVRDQGPAVLQVATNLGVRAALTESKTPVAEAVRIRGFVADAKGLLVGNQVPVFTLDQIATTLNARITNPLIRAAIQIAIVNLRSHVTIPANGFIPDNVKVWVVAVLDGTIDGCDSYIAGVQSFGAAPSGSDVISFR